jgi:hypothetical protein
MIETLAASLVTSFILPLLRDGAAAIAERVERGGEIAGEEAASIATRVWQRVRAVFDDHPEDKGVLRRLEKNKDDVATAEYFTTTLAELLESHPDVVEELSALVETPPPGSDKSVTQVMQTSGVTITITGGHFEGSPVTGISHGSGTPPSA